MELGHWFGSDVLYRNSWGKKNRAESSHCKPSLNVKRRWYWAVW